VSTRGAGGGLGWAPVSSALPLLAPRTRRTPRITAPRRSRKSPRWAARPA